MWKDIQIKQYSDSGRQGKKRNHGLYNMRQSFEEDADNNGILLDKEGLWRQTYKERREQDQDNIEITPKRYMRPMSALISPSDGFSSRQRPITALGQKVQGKKMLKIDENAEMISVPYHSETKYWRNTKKFDKTNQNVIRNHSALQRVSLGGESENYNIEEEEAKNQNLIEKQIMKNRLFSPIQSQGKHQINDRDIEQMTEGFYEHVALIKGSRNIPKKKGFKHSNLQIQDNLTDIMRLIKEQTYTKSPLIVKTKPYGKRTQSAVNKQQKVNQRYRTISGKAQLRAVRGFQL
ncbi:unnamed protein product [Paramecium sonneborni]|uniref:Uncharacterized protein n=1 Tax=Paramecium sonneborni TaxID=65129 RepID=A0A8S1QIP4_9CILI|nr:unnamed protein product [Paramecium sonneborni]